MAWEGVRGDALGLRRLIDPISLLLPIVIFAALVIIIIGGSGSVFGFR